LHRTGFEVAIETNGTQPAPPGINWICVSPKAGAELVLKCGDELKLIFPQEGADPATFENLDFRNFFLQPMDVPHREENTRLAVRYCLGHPRWRLSLQTHKLLGIPGGRVPWNSSKSSRSRRPIGCRTLPRTTSVRGCMDTPSG